MESRYDTCIHQEDPAYCPPELLKMTMPKPFLPGGEIHYIPSDIDDQAEAICQECGNYEICGENG